MFIDRYINRFNLKPNLIAGVELFFNSDENLKVCCTIVKRNGKKISILNHSDVILDLSELFTYLPKDIPICLSISGKGVLNKKLPLNSLNYSDKDILNQLIPNASASEFFIQSNECDNDVLFSVARQENVNEIINNFGSHGYLVVDLTFGPFVANLISILGNNVSSLNTANLLLEFKNNRIVEISRKTEDTYEILIQEENIPNSIVISYLSIIKYLSNFISEKDRFPSIPKIIENKFEIFYKRIFKTVGLIVLTFSFLLLFVNFIFYSKTTVQVERLQQSYNFNRKALTRLDSLKLELERKEKFLVDNNLKAGVKLTYFADRIALTLPRQITLTRLDLQPVSFDTRDDQTIQLKKGTIVVTGSVINAMALQGWLRDIKKELWVKSIEINSYKFEDKLKYGEFIISIYCYNN